MKTTNLAHYLEAPSGPELHPKARYWSQRLKREPNTKIVCEFWRKRHGLNYGPARLVVTLLGEDGEPSSPPDEVDWDPELDAELVKLGARAPNNRNEAERMGMLFVRRFSQLQAQFGDAYFNAVLVEQLFEHGLSDQPPIKSLLRHIKESRPSHDGPGFVACVGAIDGVIMARAQALTTYLHYQVGEAAEILAQAMAYYLDEQYSITSRRVLGFT